MAGVPSRPGLALGEEQQERGHGRLMCNRHREISSRPLEPPPPAGGRLEILGDLLGEAVSCVGWRRRNHRRWRTRRCEAPPCHPWRRGHHHARSCLRAPPDHGPRPATPTAPGGCSATVASERGALSCAGGSTGVRGCATCATGSGCASVAGTADGLPARSFRFRFRFRKRFRRNSLAGRPSADQVHG